ncbi:CD3337/EF1877 family mobilome membrane protein [Leuconostoc citreum]
MCGKGVKKLIILASFLLVSTVGTVQAVSADDHNAATASSVVDDKTLQDVDQQLKDTENDINKKTDQITGESNEQDNSFKPSDAQNIKTLKASLFSWQPYSEKIGVTDVGNNAGMGLAKFFWFINTLVYQINDELLSALSDDGHLTKAFTQAQNSVSGQVQKIFNQGKLLFGGLAVIGLAIMGLIYFMKGRVSQAVGLVGNLLGILLLSTIWYGGGNQLFNQVNEASSAGQAQMLKVVGNDHDEVKPGDALRVGYFERSIERPYFLMNYGKASADEVTKKGDNPYQFISTNPKRDENTLQSKVSKLKGKYPTLGKNNSFNKAGMSLVAILVSIVNAIPYDAVALFNIFVMVVELALYLLSPFVLVMALFPQFARNGYKIVGTTILWAVAKIGSAFLIILVSALQRFTDSFIAVTDFGSYAVNAFLFFFLVYIVYKFRGKLFDFVGVSYARLEGNMPKGMSLSNLREKGQRIKQSSVGQKLSQMGPMQRMSQQREVRSEMKTQQAEQKRQQNMARVREQLLGKAQAKTQKLSDKSRAPLSVEAFKKGTETQTPGDTNKQSTREATDVTPPKNKFEMKQPTTGTGMRDPKTQAKQLSGQRVVEEKREAIKRQLYGDKQDRSYQTKNKSGKDTSFERSEAPTRQDVIKNHAQAVDREQIARELLTERNKQKAQKKQDRDEKVTQLKNKFRQDQS